MLSFEAGNHGGYDICNWSITKFIIPFEPGNQRVYNTFLLRQSKSLQYLFTQTIKEFMIPFYSGNQRVCNTFLLRQPKSL